MSIGICFSIKSLLVSRCHLFVGIDAMLYYQVLRGRNGTVLFYHTTMATKKEEEITPESVYDKAGVPKEVLFYHTTVATKKGEEITPESVYQKAGKEHTTTEKEEEITMESFHRAMWYHLDIADSPEDRHRNAPPSVTPTFREAMKIVVAEKREIHIQREERKRDPTKRKLSYDSYDSDDEDSFSYTQFKAAFNRWETSQKKKKKED